MHLPQILYCYLTLDPQYAFQISARLKHTHLSYSNFCKKKKKVSRDIHLRVWLLVSPEWLEEPCSNLKCRLCWVEGSSVVNLVPLGPHITELQMHENRNFVVLVNILTPFSPPPPPPSFLKLHDTLQCVLIFKNSQAINIKDISFKVL